METSVEKGRMMNYKQIFKAEIRVSNKYEKQFAFLFEYFLRSQGFLRQHG